MNVVNKEIKKLIKLIDRSAEYIKENKVCTVEDLARLTKLYGDIDIVGYRTNLDTGKRTLAKYWHKGSIGLNDIISYLNQKGFIKLRAIRKKNFPLYYDEIPKEKDYEPILIFWQGVTEKEDVEIKEKVLVLESRLLDKYSTGLKSKKEFKTFLDLIDKKSKYITRNKALENNLFFRQIIPYVVITKGDKVFCYKRNGSEKRLRDWSIGVGGHINLQDNTRRGKKYTIRRGLKRELKEEIGIKDVSNLEFLGFIKQVDDKIVSKVHFGVAYKLEIKEDIKLDNEEIQEFEWVDLKDLEDKNLETWSNEVVEMLYKKRRLENESKANKFVKAIMKNINRSNYKFYEIIEKVGEIYDKYNIFSKETELKNEKIRLLGEKRFENSKLKWFWDLEANKLIEKYIFEDGSEDVFEVEVGDRIDK